MNAWKQRGLQESLVHAPVHGVCPKHSVGRYPMTQLKLIELYDRGLKNFESLLPLERDAFVVYDLDTYHEMEGDFADYLLSGGHETELTWLSGTLRRIGDSDSGSILSQLREMDDSQREDMPPLCEEYFELRDTRWELLKGYLAQQDAALNEQA
jgi:hypothetical protein